MDRIELIDEYATTMQETLSDHKEEPTLSQQRNLILIILVGHGVLKEDPEHEMHIGDHFYRSKVVDIVSHTRPRGFQHTEGSDESDDNPELTYLRISEDEEDGLPSSDERQPHTPDNKNRRQQ